MIPPVWDNLILVTAIIFNTTTQSLDKHWITMIIKRSLWEVITVYPQNKTSTAS